MSYADAATAGANLTDDAENPVPIEDKHVSVEESKEALENLEIDAKGAPGKAEKKVKQEFNAASKKAKQGLDDASKKTKQGLDEAGKKLDKAGKDLQKEAKKASDEVNKEAEVVGKELQSFADNVKDGVAQFGEDLKDPAIAAHAAVTALVAVGITVGLLHENKHNKLTWWPVGAAYAAGSLLFGTFEYYSIRNIKQNKQ